MQVCSFVAVVVLGTKTSWIKLFKDYLCNFSIKITHPLPELTIYQAGGIDFIFPTVDLNEITKVNKATRKIKDFLTNRHYLEVRIIFFLNYMSPKLHQILVCLNFAGMDIVSLKPSIITETLYFRVVHELNLKTHMIDNQEIEAIIYKILDTGVFENLLGLLEKKEGAEGTRRGSRGT